EKIISDLVSEVPFEQQFSEKQVEERYSLQVVKTSNERYKQYLEEYKNDIIYIEFWGSRCNACIREFQNAGHIAEEYKIKGVKFLHISIDSSQKLWEQALKFRDSDQEIHLRIGYRSPIRKKLKVTSLPRYVVYHKGKLYDDNAPPPSSPAFSKLMDKLLRK
ncbi:MAG: thioredoxin-like domain-containing protein, partial [Bacteroidota bacterium]